MKKWTRLCLGFLVGLLNGLFGAGGGMAAVPMLKASGLEARKAHATSIAITMPLSILSGILYLTSGQLLLGDATPYLPAGIAGAAVGALLLKSTSANLLRRLFGGLILFAAFRLLLR